MALQRYRFAPTADTEFIKTLKSRVDQYFKLNGVSKHANWKMRAKTILVFCMALLPLVIMMTGIITNIWALFGMWVLMGVGMAAIGTNVMHDALHGSYSTNPKINKLIGASIHFLGASGRMWQIQHNVLHHSFTNMEHGDEDIDAPSILRFSPHQKRKAIHKYQHYYAWFLYSLSTLLWTTIKDFNAIFRYKNLGLLRPGKEFRTILSSMVFWKLMYYAYILVLPIIFIPVAWYWVVLMYISMHLVMGFLLSVVFQAAHVVPETEFTAVADGTQLKRSWHVHQLFTTVNFAPGNKLVTWFSGALNFQIEHHLFPNICHIHYPKIAPIVKATAREFNFPYYSKDNFIAALRSHTKMLRDLGKPDQVKVA